MTKRLTINLYSTGFHGKHTIKLLTQTEHNTLTITLHDSHGHKDFERE